MTQAAEPLPIGITRWQEARLVGGVSLAHFVSHFYFLVLPPLFLHVREEYGVSYTQLGLAISFFSVVSTLFQTPVGFFVDRVGARINLIGGLAIGGASLIVAGLVDSFWVLVAMFGVLGLANTVYHPADYALLSDHVEPRRMAQAFSAHTFSGILGSAVAPATMLLSASYFGWRGAFIVAGLLGVICALILTAMREPPRRPHPPRPAGTTDATGWRLLVTPVMLANLAFFALSGASSMGLNNFLVVGLNELYGVPDAVGSTALTVQLLATALGVLIGGAILTWAGNRATIPIACLVVTGLSGAILSVFNLNVAALMVLMVIAGLSIGVMAPSRDMLVRSVTPPGATGAVFGFVTNGYSFSGIVFPMIFGIMMDHGYANLVFLSVLAICAISIVTVLKVASYTPDDKVVD